MLKFKPVPIGILYRPIYKYDFVNCLKRIFSDTNAIETQECYLLGDININLHPNDKKIFRNESTNTINKKIPHLTRRYLELCFSNSLKQIITRPTRPTRVTNQTATLINHILTNSRHKVSQSGVIDLGLSDHDLITTQETHTYPNTTTILIYLVAQWKSTPRKNIWKT